MRREKLQDIEGVRWHPDTACGTGVLVLAGSSGRVDSMRAELFARRGAVAESIRWFGGAGQHDGPWEISLELFLRRVEQLSRECERVLVVGTSFGAEAALLVGALSDQVNAVVALAPSDVAWAGVRADGSLTSHWTYGGEPLAFVPFDDTWEPDCDPPAYVGCYEASRKRYAERVDAARIPVERIQRLVLVAGGDDQVWPALTMAEAIAARRAQHGCTTTLVSDPKAGHRTVLPGEPAVQGGMSMRRGGNDEADRRLGAAAWVEIEPLLRR